MIDTLEKWEKEEGVKFLKRIGIKTGQTVFDFGAGVGHYSIPAALLVGSSGVVYALDIKHQLNELKRKMKCMHLNNLKIIPTNGSIKFDFKDESIDVVLLYDVLHYLEKIQRDQLYLEIFRVLKADGFMSVYPKHIIEDTPLDHFRYLHWYDVKKEIQDQNYKLQEKYCDLISHDDALNRGCVYNFIKGQYDYHKMRAMQEKNF